MAANVADSERHRPRHNGRGGKDPNDLTYLPMARENRSKTDDAQAQEDTDRGSVVARSPAFELEASAYQTGDGDVLIAEAGKGAAWVQADPKDVVDTTEWL